MSEQVTIDVPERVVRQAARVAARRASRVEDVLSEWVERAADGIPVEELPDQEVLALSEAQLTAEEDAALSDLLVKNREGTLGSEGKRQLSELMQSYEQGLLRKSQALRVAVQRGWVTRAAPAMSPTNLPDSLRRRVAEAAGDRCGYCLSGELLAGGTSCHPLALPPWAPSLGRIASSPTFSPTFCLT